MSTHCIIDIHAHFLSEETVGILKKEMPALAISLTRTDEESGRFEVAGKVANPLPSGAWDMERRLRDMDASGIDVQAVTVCPITFLYDLDPALTLGAAQVQNDQISGLTEAMPDRFMGLGTLPMQAPELAADELRRIMAKPNIHGVQIGARVMDRTLDDPVFEPVWATAVELGAFILVHPLNAVAVNPGDNAYYLTNLVGNPFDTTLAAARLVFGGVLDRHPNIKFCMAHGGGFVPYQIGRLVHGWRVRDEPKLHLARSPEESFKRLLFDAILHDPGPLEFLVKTAGASRVLLGTDYPFDMGQYDLGVVRALNISDKDKATILGGAALRLVGKPGIMNGKGTGER